MIKPSENTRREKSDLALMKPSSNSASLRVEYQARAACYCLCKIANMIWFFRTFETRWLLHINLSSEMPMNKVIIDI
jgi:hypothetical protein